MKELYVSPEVELIKFASAEAIASSEEDASSPEWNIPGGDFDTNGDWM